VTALHVSRPPDESTLLRHQPRARAENGEALLEEISALGGREGVKVESLVVSRRSQERAILRQVRRGRHNLVVLGIKARPATGERLFVGQSTAALVERLPCSVLIVNS